MLQEDTIVCKEIFLQDHQPANCGAGMLFISGAKLYIVGTAGAPKLVTSA